jgi:hypothetical protein
VVRSQSDGVAVGERVPAGYLAVLEDVEVRELGGHPLVALEALETAPEGDGVSVDDDLPTACSPSESGRSYTTSSANSANGSS